MEMKYIICKVVFILAVVIIIITLTKKKSTFKNKEKFAETTSVDVTSGNSTKTLKYFGGGYCPYSNKASNAYMVIKDFEEYAKSKGDVEIKFYWTEENPVEMEQYKIMYVPTILGKDDQTIELKLPAGTDTNKTDIELKQLLMDHIYSLL